MEVKQLCNLIDNRKNELYDLLCKLIRINSESFADYGNEEECARYIYQLCNELDLDTELYSPMEIEGFEEHPDYLPGRSLENRYNVTAVWKGLQDKNELALMAHTDTVKIGNVENWTFPPLAGIIEDGKIYGRGACDDKYALASVLFLIKILKDAAFEPKANLVFSAYSDEEYGGSHGALAAVLRYPCHRIVSMDGVEGQIWQCASGGQEIKYVYHTEKTVDSAKLTASAIPVVIEALEKFANNRRKELEENRFYAGTIVPETSLRYMGIQAGKQGMDLGVGEVSFVYYTDKEKNEIYDELRVLEDELSEKLAPMGIIGDGFKPLTRFFHYAFCEPDSDDIHTMLDSARETGGQIPLVCGSCLSDLSVISKYGSSEAYGFGMGRDFSVPGGAHQPDEYIECEKLLEYTKVIGAYILKILG